MPTQTTPHPSMQADKRFFAPTILSTIEQGASKATYVAKNLAESQYVHLGAVLGTDLIIRGVWSSPEV